MQEREKMYHSELCREDLKGAHIAITPGDPDRVEKIAAYFDRGEFLNRKREYTSWLGWAGEEPVLIISTGIGGPSTAICLEEIHKLGIDTVLRTGTCGGIALDVQAGDLVIALGAIRMDGTTKEIAPIKFPAVADLDVTLALRDAARAAGIRTHVGVVQCKDSFYGQHSPETWPVGPELKYKWEAWKQLGTLASEMESSTLFITAAARGMKAGSVFLCVWNQEREAAGLDQKEVHDTEASVRVCVDAARSLAAR